MASYTETNKSQCTTNKNGGGEITIDWAYTEGSKPAKQHVWRKKTQKVKNGKIRSESGNEPANEKNRPVRKRFPMLRCWPTPLEVYNRAGRTR